MEESTLPKPSFKRGLTKVVLRTLLLLAITVGVSLLYKTLIEVNFFNLFGKSAVRKFVFCAFELLLLAGYWYNLYILSKIWKHNNRNLWVTYLRTCCVFAAFGGIVLLCYRLLSRELFLWFFRMTVNLIGLRCVTSTPKDLTPYLLGFLGGTFLVMLLEPPLALLIFFIREKLAPR